MIRFNCPHCGNEFAVRDTYAGRDGWCRVCKELVLVPTEEGKGPHLDDLPAEERVSRLRAKLKYAATQADTYKQITLRIWTETDALLLGRDIKDRKLTPEGIEASLAAWRTAWEGRSAEAPPPPADTEARAKLESEVEALRAALEIKSRAFAEANDEADRLRSAVAALESERTRPAVDAETTSMNGKADALREELNAARLAAAAAETIKADTESALNAIRAELSAAQAEREDAQRATRVLKDEVESLRVELDAALYAKAGAVQDEDAAERAQLEAQARETSLREELTETRLKLADVDAKHTASERVTKALREELAAAQAVREDAQQRMRVFQDEVESLRVELDAALHAKAAPMSNDGDGRVEASSEARGPDREHRQRDGASKAASVPVWHDAPVVIAQSKRNVTEPAEEMELVEAEIEGLDPFETDAMMSSYLHFLSDSPGSGK